MAKREEEAVRYTVTPGIVSNIALLLTTAILVTTLFAFMVFITVPSVRAGQVQGSSASPDIPVSHHDRVYTADQISNVVTVTDPIDNKLLGVINLGQVLPGSLSPLYLMQLLVHGMGFSPDHHTSSSSQSR